jgi:hypothetical protein
MKNKKALAVIAVLIVIVGLYGAYRVYAHFKRLSTTPAGQTQTTATTAPETLGSLKDLIANGGSQTCTYSTDQSQGTVYMSGGKVDADIDTTVGSVVEKAHMIIANDSFYLWMDGKTSGYKMAYNPNTTPAPAGAKTNNASGMLDPNTQMNFKCSSWLTDDSKFALPSGVTFSAISLPQAAPAAVGSPAAGGANSQCSYCDSLTGDSKTQCLTALKCN